MDRAENLRTLQSTQKTRTMEISQVCTPPREKRTCQPKLVRARSTGPRTLRALQQPPALGVASWSRLSDTASTPSSFVIDLFSASTDLQARLGSFSDDYTIFSTKNSRYFVHLGKWSDFRRNALTTSIFALSGQKTSTSAKRDTTVEIASFEFFQHMSSQQRQFVCRCLFAVRACISLKIPLLSRQPSRLVFVEIQWAVKYYQQVRFFWMFTTVLLDHTRRNVSRLVFGRQSDRACLHSLFSYRFRCHVKHGFCSFREGHKHLLLQGTLTQQSAKYPPRLVAFTAGLLVDA